MEKKLLSTLFILSLFFLNPVDGFGQCDTTIPPTVEINSGRTDHTFCAGETITFTAVPKNVGSNPTYQWRVNGENRSGETNSTFIISNLQNGHIVSVVMNPNCTGTTAVTSNTITVKINPIPSTPIISGDNSVCAGDTLSLNASTISGATYNWTGPDGFTFTGQNLSRSGASVNMSGTYAVTATVNGCTSNQGTYNVTVNSIPGAPTANNSGPVCAGGTINLTANNITGASYSWTGPNNFTSSVQNPIINNTTAAMAGTYSVWATVNECSSPVGTTTVVVNAAPNAPTAGNGGAVCVGSTIELTASSINGATYSWTGPGGFTSTEQNPTRTGATTAMAGTYSVIATVNGCPSTAATTNIIVNTIPSAPSVSSNGPVCVGATINLTAGTIAGATYSWTGPDNFTSSTQNPTIPNATITKAGEYLVTATVNECTSSVAKTIVVVNTIPTAPTASNGGATCVGGTITLMASTIANATYSWTGPGGFTSNVQNPTRAGATTAMAGIYNVTATVDGCTSSSSSTTVVVNTIPAAPTAGSNSPVCMNGTINLTANTITGATYSWTGPDGFTSNLQNPTVSNLTAAKAGTYSVTATVNGCTSPAGTTSVTITPNVTPSVSITSTSTAICSSAGTSVTFTATPVNGGNNPTFQWRRNGTNIPGATGAIYTVSSLASPSTISVVMTSSAICSSPTSATSNDIVMVVYTSAPSTTTGNNNASKPSGTTSVCPGPAANSLKYIIPENMTQTAEYYTWHLPSGFNIVSGANTREIIVSVPGAGAVSGNNEISVTAYNPCGNSGKSGVLVVTVGSFAAVDVGPDKSICLGTDFTLTNTLSGSANNVTWTIQNGTGTISGGPYPAPFIYTPSAAGTATLRATTNTATGSCTSSTGIDDIIITTNQIPAITAQPTATQTLCSGTLANFSVTATGTGLTYQWQKNGTNISGATTSTYQIPSPTTADSGNYTVIVSGASPCTSVTSTVSELKVNEKIAISSQPAASQTLCSGSATSLSVTATGTGLTYQWKKNGTDISGANVSTLALNNLTTDDSGEYTVLITGTSPCEPLLSEKAVVTVNEVVTITEQPTTSQTLCSGSIANFSVTAKGTGLAYQWKKNGTNILNATSTTLTLENVTTADSGDYTVEVTGTDPCQSVTSGVAKLVVNEIIAITDQPAASQTLCSGSSANFSVTATGTGLTYQWKKDGNNISGATNSTLTLLNITPNDSADYTVEISGTDPCSPVTSSVSKLVVNEIITITEQPTETQTLCVGSTANFSITATGTGLTYQWKKNGIDISNATSASLSLSEISTSDAGEYTVMITGTDPCEPVLSGKAILIVDELTVITKDLEYTEPLSVCAGFPFSFGIEAAGTNITYKWYRGSTLLSNTTSSFSVSQATATDAGIYTVKVTGACGEITSNEVEIIVNQSITINTQPKPTIPVCLGETSISINVDATGDIYDYVWRKNGIPVSEGSKYTGTTGPSLTILNLLKGDSGSYDVVISSPEGSCSQIISNPSVVTVYDPPTVDAGPDLEVCSSQTSIQLSGATATNHTSLNWTTNGEGQINNATDLATATYSPVAADLGKTLEFTLTAKLMVEGDQLCEDAEDTREIKIIPQPVITQFSYTSENTAVTANFCETDNTLYTPTTAGENLSGGSGEYSVDKSELAINTSTGAFNPNGKDPGTYVITYTYTADSQSGACTISTKTFTVNITKKPVADFSYENTPFCSDAGNVSPLMGTEAVKGTFSSTEGLVFVSSATGEINISGSTPGTYTVTNTIAAANGCVEVISTSVIVINLKPKADFTYSASEYCSDATNPVIQFTGAGKAGIFSEKNGKAGLKFVDTSTGEIDIADSAPGNYIILNTIEIDGDGCDPVSAEFAITINQKQDPTFSYNTTGEYCISDGKASVTEGFKTGGTFSSSTLSSFLNSTTGELTWNSTANIIGEHTITYTIPAGGGCAQASHQVTISIDPLPIAGVLNFPTFGRILESCSNPGPDYNVPIQLTGHQGTIARWRYREGSKPEWITIAHTEPILTAAIIRSLSINESTIFEAEIVNGGCTTGIFSQSATLSIISSNIAPNPVTASPGVICTGNEVTLSASSGYGTGPGIMEGGAFDNASITNSGWRVRRENSTQDLGFSTSSNNSKPDIWSRVTPHNFTTADVNNPGNLTDMLYDAGVEDGNKGFVLVSGNNPSTLETPVFNTFAMETATLTFDQAYNLTGGSSIRVEISTDGGANYNYVVFERKGPLSSGNFGNFGAVNNTENKIVIDLSDYLGLPNLRIRFRYLGTRTGDTWALDAIKLPQGPTGVEMIWTDYTDPAKPVVIGTGTSEKWTPSLIGLNKFEIRTRLTFDSTGAQCPVVENFSTINVFVFDQYTSTAEAFGGSCGNSSVKLKATITSGTKGVMQEFNAAGYTTPDGYTGKWEVSGPSGYTFVASHLLPSANDPNAEFNPGIQGDFILTWKLTPTAKGVDNKIIENTTCPPSPAVVNVKIQDCLALDFDGVDDFVDLGNGYTGNYSIEAWIRPESKKADGTDADLINGTIISTKNREIIMGHLTGLVSADSRWYHIAVDAAGKLYVDGIDTETTISKTGTERAFIGARWNAPNVGNHFSGWIEEVRIWNGNITQENIRFTMNQRLKAADNIGVVVDMDHPDAPAFGGLAGYYQLLATNILPGGYTKDLATNAVDGRLRNMTTTQENTAPLPYYTGNEGAWDTAGTWARPAVWNIPNTNGITWNIVRNQHKVTAPRDISVLGLISEPNSTLDMVGTIPANESHEGVGTGNALTISHYLKLDGVIDLNGESQLLQPELSIVAPASTGYLDRDQQGKRNSFIYNYWASPVSATTINGGYSVGGVLLDGTNPAAPATINFQAHHAAADGARTPPITISTYWLWKFSPATANAYSEWKHIGSTGTVNSGEGFTMKGTTGSADLSDGQNYTFRGKPHNGDITLTIGSKQNYLIGNPYPSSMDGYAFIEDHIGTDPVFDGSLYFWDHIAIETHILKEYVGGYAVLNLSGGVPAVSIDERINDNLAKTGKVPKQFIPVGQGFLINSTNPDSTSTKVFGGAIKFRNDYREFKVEGTQSTFLKPETVQKTAKSKNSDFKKIRLSFSSPVGYWRQILVGAVPGTTDGFDLGYDAHLYDDNVEDMYWVQGNNSLVIQGVNDFNKERVLPLGVKIKEEKPFTIRIDTVENAAKSLRIYLHDKLNDSIHDLRKGHYVSTSKPGTINNRFEIVFHKEEIVPPPVVVIPTEPDEIYEEFGILIRHGRTDRELQILNPHELAISNMYIFDLRGNKLEDHRSLPGGKEFRMPVASYSSGVYIVQLVVEGRVVSKKIIINN